MAVWDLSGKLILKAEPGDSVDTSKLTDGVYLLTGKTTDGENFSIRFIKKQD